MRFLPFLAASAALGTSLGFFGNSAGAQDIHVRVNGVTDNRVSGQGFGSLRIELKLFGEDAAKVRAARATVSSAEDDQGQLLEPADSIRNFATLDNSGPFNQGVVVSVTNPPRAAKSVKNVKGTLSLFIPSNDPDSIVVVDNLSQNFGKVIQSPALQSENIELMLFDRASFDKYKEKLATPSSSTDQDRRFPGLAMRMGTISTMKPGDIAVRVIDPDHHLISVELQTKDGQNLQSNRSTSMTMGNQYYVFRAITPFPPDARVTCLVKTQKASATIPFTLDEVPLP